MESLQKLNTKFQGSERSFVLPLLISEVSKQLMQQEQVSLKDKLKVQFRQQVGLSHAKTDEKPLFINLKLQIYKDKEKKQESGYFQYKDIKSQILMQQIERQKIDSLRMAQHKIFSKFKLRRQKDRDLEYFSSFLSEIWDKTINVFYKKQQKIVMFIDKILQNWSFYSNIYQQLFSSFFYYYRYLITEIMDLCRIYPSLTRIHRLISKKLKIFGTLTNQLDQNFESISKLIIPLYIQQHRHRSNQTRHYLHPIKLKKVCLTDYIYEQQYFFQTLQQWQDVFELLKLKIIQFYHNVKQRKYQQVVNHPIPQMKCLGCAQFFYEGENLMLSSSNYQEHIIFSESVFQLQNEDLVLLEQICGLLNSRGGIILFDCAKQNLEVFAMPTVILEGQKQQILHKIDKFIQVFYPKIYLGQEIKVNFVPIASKMFNDLSFKGENHEYLKGNYITRIIVRPLENHKVYFYLKQNIPVIFTIKNPELVYNPKFEKIKMENIYRFIKAKVRQNIHEFGNSQFFKLSYAKKKHKCIKPNNGEPLIRPIRIKRDYKELQEKQRFSWFITLNQQYHQIIKRNLKKFNFRCEIILPFVETSLQSASNSAIIQCNFQWRQFQIIFRDKPQLFNFGGNYLQPNIIRHFVRLIDHSQISQIPSEQFKQIADQMKKLYPKESLQLCEFIDQRQEPEFYLRIAAKEPALYLYLYLRSIKKSVILPQFKNLRKLFFAMQYGQLKKIWIL